MAKEKDTVNDEAAESAAPENEAGEPAVQAAAGEPAAGEDASEPEAAPEPAPEGAPAAEVAETAAGPGDELPYREPAAEDAAGPGAAAEPRRKRKRLPRALRPKRSRPARAKAAARAPIVRLPKPERERGRRQERQGTVVSDAMDKTIVVKVDVIKAHTKYKKVVRRSTTFHAHDEENRARVGDVVRIVETRPLSKTKRWRLAEIVEAAR